MHVHKQHLLKLRVILKCVTTRHDAFASFIWDNATRLRSFALNQPLIKKKEFANMAERLSVGALRIIK